MKTKTRCIVCHEPCNGARFCSIGCFRAELNRQELAKKLADRLGDWLTRPKAVKREEMN